MRAYALVAFVVALLVAAAPAAATPSPSDLEAEFVCPTCKTTLDQSDSPIARRMKQMIRSSLAEGKTEKQIRDELVAQFGPAVVAEPPKKGFDLLAWLVPLGILAAGAVGRRRDRLGLAPPACGRAPAGAARPGTRAPRRRRARALRPMSWSEIPVALVAGFLSFLAPCVLPLVPGYLSTVSAVSAEDLGRPGTARRVVTSSIPFVLGFTAFFVLLGVGASLLGGSLFRDQFLLEEVAGFVLVVFGLAFMGLLPWPERLVGAGLVQGARSRGSRVLLGGAFAVCAAPCIGPVLAAILVLAGSSDTALEGAGLLAVYSLGLAIPFVLAGALFTRAMGAFRWLRDHYRAIQFAGGLVMVALGLLLFFGRFYVLRIYVNRALEWIGLEPVF